MMLGSHMPWVCRYAGSASVWPSPDVRYTWLNRTGLKNAMKNAAKAQKTSAHHARMRHMSGSVGEIEAADQIARDDHLLDLRGALVYFSDLGVAIVALDGKLRRVS